ncbi:SpoIIE family protein phosphatase [Chloroflexota bacterium]
MKQRPTPEQVDILVVDDTPDNLRLLSQMLSEHGYGVRAVTSGQRALESARMMPPDGYSVCKQLKSDKNTLDIPVIFISALDDIQDKVKAFQVGGVDYITKPFQIEEVLARTETHLALQKLQNELQEVNKKFERELLLAGKMQASFLPNELPEIAGWGLSPKLVPALETSGDFFDVFQLPGGNMGLLIADVVDKGVGAALFMVLSWSLLRTYALEFPTEPERVLAAVDERIRSDTGADNFVTVFYGVLDPKQGTLVYSNAGHNSPVLFKAGVGVEPNRMKATGTPLGILENQTWERGMVCLEGGDVCMLYTDGITDAQNGRAEFFGEQRLNKSLDVNAANSAVMIRDGLMRDVHDFMSGEPLYDDIGLIVLKRE